MSEGTKLTVLGQSGQWLRVLTETGLKGWAHSNWIRPSGVRPTGSSADRGDQCNALWLRRNSFFDAHGYCFSSARGKAAFDNENCITGLAAADVPLTASERSEVARIRALETQLGCN